MSSKATCKVLKKYCQRHNFAVKQAHQLTPSDIRIAGWTTAAKVEQSAQSVELPAVLPRLQTAVLLQHPGGGERT